MSAAAKPIIIKILRRFFKLPTAKSETTVLFNIVKSSVDLFLAFMVISFPT